MLSCDREVIDVSFYLSGFVGGERQKIPLKKGGVRGL